MCVPTEISARDRARWLAELGRALHDAQQMLFEFGFSMTLPPEAGELFQRIEAAKAEVRSLQLSRTIHPASGNDPKWTETSPWARTSAGSR